MRRSQLLCLTVPASLVVMLSIAAPGMAIAEAADPTDLTRQTAGDLAALISAGPGPDVSPAVIEAALTTLFTELGKSDAELAATLPAAISQAARLAQTEERPATRLVLSDLTRDMLGKAVELAGMHAESEPILRIWAEADPVVRADGSLLMTASDVAAFDELVARASYKGRLSAEAFWDSNADQPANRVLPARLGAWAAGAVAAWDDLDAAQRTRVAEVLDEPAIPPADLIQAVTGTGDLVGWLAAVQLPLGDQSRAASPELVALLDGGAFAGPLAPLMTPGIIMPMPGGGAADQLMRLNNWSASTGEMTSWDSYRAMTQGW